MAAPGVPNRIHVEPETDADTVVDAAHEPVVDDGNRAPEPDARTVADLAPAEKDVRLGLERIARVLAGQPDDHLLGPRATREQKRHEGGDDPNQTHDSSLSGEVSYHVQEHRFRMLEQGDD